MNNNMLVVEEVEEPEPEPMNDDDGGDIITQSATCSNSISECTFVSNFWIARTDNKKWTIKNNNCSNNNNNISNNINNNDDGDDDEDDDEDDDDDDDNKINNHAATEDDVLGVSLKENIRLIIPPPSHAQQKSKNNKNKNKNRNRNRNHHHNHKICQSSSSSSSSNNNNNNNNNNSNNTRFHIDLKTDDLDGMVVMFQAKAKESIVVLLSPYPSLLSSTASVSSSIMYYEIVFGANNNTSTTIRRRWSNSNNDHHTMTKENNDESDIVNIPSRVCRGFITANSNNNNNNECCWTSYWVCLSLSKLYIGLGCSPGKECFGFMEMKMEEDKLVKDDDDNQQQQQPIIRYVGIGNNANTTTRTSTSTSKNNTYNNNSLMMHIEVRNLVVTNVPPCLESVLKKLPTSQDDLPIVCLSLASTSAMREYENENENENKANDDETLELKRYMEEYKTECILRKKRAQKYDTKYNEKPIIEFLPWSKAKRLLLSSSQQQQQQRNNSNIDNSSNNKTSTLTTGGFVTGDIDFRDPEETAKREARKARFTAAAAANNDTTADDTNNTTNSSQKNNDKVDIVNDDNNTRSSIEGLPVEQAWDKEDMLRPLRKDPPSYLWEKSSSNTDIMTTSTNTITSSIVDPFTMYKNDKSTTSWITDKLHISAIDWAAFKQIRNEDITKYFESYGPIKYIEWLGDISCNVCFDNKHSASRALICLSNELPSPPQPQPHSLLSRSSSSSSSSQPPTVVTNVIDLGCMTWRFGKYPIRKVSNDRHGCKGTRARFLLRVGTTEDILMERPNTWPEPPGKFSSDRILGPESDYADNNNNKNDDDSSKKNKRRQQLKKTKKKDQQDNRSGSKSKRKRQRKKSDNNNNSDNSNMNRNVNNSNSNSTTENLLNKGLSSGSRSGFSVKEMEKERQAKKKQKTC
jgi:hypothetical protein